MDLVTYLRNQWDRVAAWLAVCLGGLLLLLGWLGVSDAVFPAAQIPYIVSGGLGGIFLLGLGATLWLSADLRDEWRKLDDIEQRLAAGAVASTTQGGNGSPNVGRGSRDDEAPVDEPVERVAAHLTKDDKRARPMPPRTGRRPARSG